MTAHVASVARDGHNRFSKTPTDEIVLIAGEGVAGDAHRGVTVKHRSRVARDPSQPNLRQVHLIHAELFDEVAGKGFTVAPADLGENITTRGIDLLSLPRGATLRLGREVALTITGLRNPCTQIDGFAKGLLDVVLIRPPGGALIRKTGIMAVVEAGGTVRPGDPIRIDLPAPPHLPLKPV